MPAPRHCARRCLPGAPFPVPRLHSQRSWSLIQARRVARLSLNCKTASLALDQIRAVCAATSSWRIDGGADDIREVLEVSRELKVTANGYLERAVAAPSSEGVLGFHGLVDAFEPTGPKVWPNLSKTRASMSSNITAVHLNSNNLLVRFSRNIQELSAICLERSLQRLVQVGSTRRLESSDDTVAEEPAMSVSRRTGRCAASCSPRQQC